MPKRVTVYDLQTGVASERYAIVAKEIVALDPQRYSFTPPSEKKAASEKVQGQPAAPAAAPAAKPVAAAISKGSGLAAE